MSNQPRMKKAEKGKYEGREYLDYEEAGDYLGLKRATLFNYIDDLKIETHKFLRDRRKYLAIADVKRIEAVIDKPWLAQTVEKPPMSNEGTQNTPLQEGNAQEHSGEKMEPPAA